MQISSELFLELSQINFLRIGFIVALAWGLLQAVQWLIPHVADVLPTRWRLNILPLMPIFQLLILGGAIIEITPLIFGNETENLLAASGAVAISLGFAFQDYISSIIAGVVATYERPYRVGDWIRIDGAYGEIVSLGFRAIEMVTPDDTVVIIPNKKLWDTIIYNDNNGQREHQCVADFYLDPNHDAMAVRLELHKVALTSPYLQLNRPIVVIVHEKPWGTHYRLKAYPIDGREQFKFTSDLTVRGKASLNRMGLQAAQAVVAASD